MKFQDIHISCWHAIAAIREFNDVVNDLVHEAYFITSYNATYQAPFTSINVEDLLDGSDCEVCNIQPR